MVSVRFWYARGGSLMLSGARRGFGMLSEPLCEALGCSERLSEALCEVLGGCGMLSEALCGSL